MRSRRRASTQVLSFRLSHVQGKVFKIARVLSLLKVY
jgi:hypothetical protein